MLNTPFCSWEQLLARGRTVRPAYLRTIVLCHPWYDAPDGVPTGKCRDSGYPGATFDGCVGMSRRLEKLEIWGTRGNGRIRLTWNQDRCGVPP
jgi:hypothetical protein